VCPQKTDVKKRRDNNTTVAYHTFSEGHSFKFSDVKILGHEENEEKRRMLEVIHIIKRKPYTVNYKNAIIYRRYHTHSHCTVHESYAHLHSYRNYKLVYKNLCIRRNSQSPLKMMPGCIEK